jgi:hypothetical protein
MTVLRQRASVIHIMESFGSQVALCGGFGTDFDNVSDTAQVTRAATCNLCLEEKLWRMAVER